MGDDTEIWIEPCFYCGMPATTVDHVTPRCYHWALALAKQATDPKAFAVETIPACFECNMLAGRRLFLHKWAKKKYLKERRRKKYARILRMPDWSPTDIAGISGYALRQAIIAGLERRDQLRRQIAW